MKGKAGDGSGVGMRRKRRPNEDCGGREKGDEGTDISHRIKEVTLFMFVSARINQQQKTKHTSKRCFEAHFGIATVRK